MFALIFVFTNTHGLSGNNPSGVFPGFGVDRGAWVSAEFGVARTGPLSYTLSIALGASRYTYAHVWASNATSDMPQQIDAIGIWFPNSRDYTYVDLAPPTSPTWRR
jgi:hypothetical protein